MSSPLTNKSYHFRHTVFSDRRGVQHNISIFFIISFFAHHRVTNNRETAGKLKRAERIAMKATGKKHHGRVNQMLMECRFEGGVRLMKWHVGP